MRTIIKWLQDLPEPHKTRAIENMESFSSDADRMVESLWYALSVAFDWWTTSEGRAYWMEVANGNFNVEPAKEFIAPTGEDEDNKSWIRNLLLGVKSFQVGNMPFEEMVDALNKNYIVKQRK